MAHTIAIPDDLKEFGGLKVALVSAISDTIDSIEVKRKVVEDQFFSGTRTASNNYDLTGFAGTSLLLLQINVTAHSGNEVVLLLQKLLPDGVTYTDVARFDINATGHKLVSVKAEPSAGAIIDRTNIGIADLAVVDGPWNDRLRLQVYGANWTGTSVTFSVDVYAL